jgi:hypothetical protein
MIEAKSEPAGWKKFVSCYPSRWAGRKALEGIQSSKELVAGK